jgi:hypothetical protein
VPLTSPDVSPTRRFITITQEMSEAGSSLGPILLNHPTQSTTTVNGWGSVLFGLPFLALGIFIDGAALNLYAVHGKRAPNWMIALLGGFFLLAGASLFIHGVVGIAKRARFAREAALHPGQIWLADYHWHREGFRFSAVNATLSRLYFALFWSAFLVPFFWIGMHGALPFLIGASIFALIGLFIWYRFLQMLADLILYGNSFLNYDNFPYFLGGSLNASLRAPRHLSNLDELTLTLRCVTEQYVTRNRNSQVVCYELFKNQITLSRERLAAYAGGSIPIQFAIPADKPCTTLVSAPPTYWEIEARGSGRGASFEAYFLVPVYRAS